MSAPQRELTAQQVMRLLEAESDCDADLSTLDIEENNKVFVFVVDMTWHGHHRRSRRRSYVL